MATAELNPRKVETREVVVEEETITLTLSRAEAEVIRSFAGTVHLHKGDIGNIMTPTYSALCGVLGGFSKYTPESVLHQAVIWKER